MRPFRGWGCWTIRSGPLLLCRGNTDDAVITRPVSRTCGSSFLHVHVHRIAHVRRVAVGQRVYDVCHGLVRGLWCRSSLLGLALAAGGLLLQPLVAGAALVGRPLEQRGQHGDDVTACLRAGRAHLDEHGGGGAHHGGGQAHEAVDAGEELDVRGLAVGCQRADADGAHSLCQRRF